MNLQKLLCRILALVCVCEATFRKYRAVAWEMDNTGGTGKLNFDSATVNPSAKATDYFGL